MPIVNISSVTRTIIRLLQVGLDPSEFDGNPATNPTIVVSAIPPDEVTSGGSFKQVSVHLLHILETPEFRNFPPGPRVRNSPIQQLPMGLVLQYVISVAHEEQGSGGEESTSQDALDAQDILGKAARLLHDFPIVTPTTTVPVPPNPVPVSILQGDLVGAQENIELILRPAHLEENLNFWATQNQKLARACLFVEARVAVLEPKPPEIMPGIVLSVGNFIFPNRGPELLGSSNALRFNPPNLPGFASINASPARVAMFPDDQAFDASLAVGTIEDNTLLSLQAASLSPGKRILLLRTAKQELTIDLDQPDPNNSNWQFAIGSNAITLRFRSEVRAKIGSPAVPSVVRLSPGIYSARVLLEDTRLGTTARPRSSNEIALAVIPQILDVAPTIPHAVNDYELKLAGRYLVAVPPEPGFPAPDPALAPTPPTVFVPVVPELDLSVNGQVLSRVNAVGDLVSGTYCVASPDAIRFMLFDPTNPTNIPSTTPFNPLPVQLLVNGVASTPAWLKVQAT